VLFAFDVLGLVSSVLSQETGWKSVPEMIYFLSNVTWNLNQSISSYRFTFIDKATWTRTTAWAWK